jgi:hypothetical protein
VVDGRGVAIEDADVLAIHYHLVDDLETPLLVHARRNLFASAEGTKDGFGLTFVLDRADAIAAEFMVAGQSRRGQYDVRADDAEDPLVELFMHGNS